MKKLLILGVLSMLVVIVIGLNASFSLAADKAVPPPPPTAGPPPPDQPHFLPDSKPLKTQT